MGAPKDPADLVGLRVIALKVIDAAHAGAPAVPAGTPGRVEDYDESEGHYHVDFGEPWGFVLCDPKEITPKAEPATRPASELWKAGRIRFNGAELALSDLDSYALRACEDAATAHADEALAEAAHTIWESYPAKERNDSLFLAALCRLHQERHGGLFEVTTAPEHTNYANMQSGSIAGLAEKAKEAGLVTLGADLEGLASALERGIMTPIGVAAQLAEQAGLCAFRAKALDALGDDLQALASACRKAGAS